MRLSSKIKFSGALIFSIFASMVLIIDSSHVSATVPYIAERVNLTPSGTQTASGNVQAAPVLSQDGRYIAFATSSSDIVASDTNSRPDIFVRDRKVGSTVRANLSSTGAEIPTGFFTPAGSSDSFKMSANGRFIVFASADASVTAGDTNGKIDIFLRDLSSNTTEMISTTPTGGQLNDDSKVGDISADGRYIVFTSAANNVVPGDVNNREDVFVRDRKQSTTTLISKTNVGVTGNKASIKPAISCDGSYIAFASDATDLVAGDTNGQQDIFLADRITGGTVTNITLGANNFSLGGGSIDISCNGETIVFESRASNLVPNDTNGGNDIFAYSMVSGIIQRVNLDSMGNQTSAGVSGLPSSAVVDFSGRYVVFQSTDSNLVVGDTNSQQDVFLRDVVEGTTQIVSKRNSATQTTQISFYPAISLNGREVVFASGDTGYVSGDTNSTEDIFVSKTGI